MLREIKLELKKNMYVPYIVVEIVGIILLCFSATGETDMSGKQISIFSLMIQVQQGGNAISKSALALWQAGIGVAIVFRDKYMLVCLPFMINYIYQQVLSKMTTDAMAVEAWERLYRIEALRPENIMNLSLGWNWFLSVFLMVALYGILAVGFYCCVKRGDCSV